ncbi:MAG: family 20 glycosylhydrolase [Kiritimatiellaeota bacterium]|nr:family 20 glycosylhydrolase [Kiritimatiellota bacterium]
MSADIILLPQPRNLTRTRGAFRLAPSGATAVAGDPVLLAPLTARLHDELQRAGHPGWTPGRAPDREIRLRLDQNSGRTAQRYGLEITPTGVHLTAGDPAGLFHGLMTLRQLLRQFPDALPACVIEDQPDYPARGVLLDISRDKVPTMATLCALVDRLAEWKINHLELYTEHTFAYARHRAVWKNASPMTAAEIRRLDAFCRERFIELMPNQNSFGHLTRWLSLPRYRPLAECPDGYVTPWGERRHEPFSLDPTNPAGLALLGELYDELLPNFSSRAFNVGCDETWDLGQGRSRAACAQRGRGRVYLQFLLKIHAAVRQRGRTMHFWGDIMLQHPELVAELPRDVVPLCWGYEADHPFDQQAAIFAAAGLPFYVCPGTSSWNSLVGRTDNMLANLRNAAAAGLRHGAVGYLVTDWGDHGHWQPLPVSFPGFAAGAALGWCGAANQAALLAAQLDRHVFADDGGVMGRLALDLGNVHRATGVEPANASVLFHLLHDKDLGPWLEKMPAGALEQTARRLDEILAPLDRARLRCSDADLIHDEFASAARMVRHGLRRAAGRPARELAGELPDILAEFRRLWLARNRPGGLDDSGRVLEERLREHRAGGIGGGLGAQRPSGAPGRGRRPALPRGRPAGG